MGAQNLRPSSWAGRCATRSLCDHQTGWVEVLTVKLARPYSWDCTCPEANGSPELFSPACTDTACCEAWGWSWKHVFSVMEMDSLWGCLLGDTWKPHGHGPGHLLWVSLPEETAYGDPLHTVVLKACWISCPLGSTELFSAKASHRMQSGYICCLHRWEWDTAGGKHSGYNPKSTQWPTVQTVHIMPLSKPWAWPIIRRTELSSGML